MRTLTSLACISALSLLTACGMPDDGHYDANGNYVPPPNATTDAQRTHSPSPGQTSYNYYYPGRHYDRYDAYDAPHVYVYDRPGYYDYNGYYIAESTGFDVPAGMFPPRGMCRVWFADRVPSAQPGIESCDNIRSRVPAGAYIIYGG